MRPLSIARLNRCSKVLGPGRRAVIWTHGCSRHCPHCIAREMNLAPPEAFYSADELYGWVAECKETDGITISGGEPFEQPPETFLAFLEKVRRDPRNLSVLCYTGGTIEKLRSNELFRRILECIDILIDGPYVHALNDGRKWRGSSNQRIHVLNPGFRAVFESAENDFSREIEVALTSTLRLELTGIPPRGFLEKLTERLEENGYSLALAENSNHNILETGGKS